MELDCSVVCCEVNFHAISSYPTHQFTYNKKGLGGAIPKSARSIFLYFRAYVLMLASHFIACIVPKLCAFGVSTELQFT